METWNSQRVLFSHFGTRAVHFTLVFTFILSARLEMLQIRQTAAQELSKIVSFLPRRLACVLCIGSCSSMNNGCAISVWLQ